MDGLDLEVGGPVPWIDQFVDLRVFGGYYNYENEVGGSDISGFKARAEARLTDNLCLDAAYYEDDRLTGSNWFFGARVSIPLGRDGIPTDTSSPRLELAGRMTENVIRDPRIRSSESGFIENPKRREVQRRSTISKRSTTRTVPVDIAIDQDVIFVDSDNPEIGDGTLDNPFQSITLAQSEASIRAQGGETGQTIYVFSSDPGYDEAVIFDGTGIDRFRIDLLDSSNAITFNGAPLSGADPQSVWGAPVGTVPLVLTNLEQIEISGFNITGEGADALVATSVGLLTINQTTLNSTGFDARALNGPGGPSSTGGNALNLTGVAEIRTNGIVINATGGETGVRIRNSGRVGGSSVLDIASSDISNKSHASVLLQDNIGNLGFGAFNIRGGSGHGLLIDGGTANYGFNDLNVQVVGGSAFRAENYNGGNVGTGTRCSLSPGKRESTFEAAPAPPSMRPTATDCSSTTPMAPTTSTVRSHSTAAALASTSPTTTRSAASTLPTTAPPGCSPTAPTAPPSSR